MLREKPCTPEHCMLPVDSAGAGGRRRKRKPGVIDLTEGASPLTHAGFGGSCDAHASSGEHGLGGRRQFVDLTSAHPQPMKRARRARPLARPTLDECVVVGEARGGEARANGWVTLCNPHAGVNGDHTEGTTV